MPSPHALARVAVIRTRPETVLEDHERLLRVAGLDAGPTAAGPMLVCLDQEPGGGDHPGAATPPWQLEGVVRALLAAGLPAEAMFVHLPSAWGRAGASGGRDPRPQWRRVASACGLVEPRPTAPDEGTEAVRLLCAVLRMDRALGLPGSLGVLAAHLLAPAALVDLDRRPQALIDAWRALPGGSVAGAVLDATVCGDGLGVTDRRPIAAHLLLASRDPVAVDAVAACLAGLDPRRLPLPAAAQAAGFGCADPTRIALVGDVNADAAVEPARGLVAGLPPLGLEAAAAVRAPGWRPRPRWLGWTALLSGAGPLAAWRARRQRDRHQTSPWGRLRRHYERHDRHGGGTA